MKLKIVVMVFLFGNLLIGYGQSKMLKGTVIDNQSKIGIEGVIISTADGLTYSLTNGEGNFEFVLDDKQDQLIFNHINYQTKVVNSKTATLIELDLINKDLEELIVYAKPLSAIFSPAFLNANRLIEKGDLYRTYSREFNMVNDNLRNVADGLVDYYIENPKKRPTIEVKQNRVFASSKDIQKGTFEKVMNTIGMGDLRDFLTDNSGIHRIQNVFNETDTYDFITRKKIGMEGEERIVIEFMAKENLSGWKYYEGYVVFTADQQQIVEYKYTLSRPYEKNRKIHNLIVMKAYFNDMVWQGVYREQEGTYHLFYKAARMDVQFIRKKQGSYRMNVFREVQVNEIEKNVEIPKKMKYRELSLFSMRSNYQTEFWKNRNIRVLTTEEEAILQSLEEKSQL